MNCDHKDKKGNYTYYEEDFRVDTDRGLYGDIQYYCTKCDKDITQEVKEKWH